MLQWHVVIFMKNTSSRGYDVIVAGGGAAGMVAAIFAARAGASVLVIEFNDRLGKKILATGNGRCNYTNRAIDLNNYYGADRAFLEQVFAGFSEQDTEEFFRNLGIEPYEQDGLLYPRSKQAKSIQEALIREIQRLPVTLVMEKQVKRIEKTDPGFLVTTADKETFLAESVILACGGKASAIRGSRGDGYYLASCLGHEITEPVPALVQVHAADPLAKMAAGVRTDAGITTWIDDKKAAFWQGELQITDYGLSGIVVFQSSRLVAYGLLEKKDVCLEVDFLPEYSQTEAEDLLQARLQMRAGALTLEQTLQGLLHDKLIAPILKRAGLAPDKFAKDCNKEDKRRLLAALRHYVVKITDTHGFSNAQVTAGGIKTSRIDPKTMESNLVPGLFFAGEVVDVDGICGGYNLQWAWSSGALAGMHCIGKRK